MCYIYEEYEGSYMNNDIMVNNAEYLVEKYLNEIVRLALVYVKNLDDAEDIAQQVFVIYLYRKPQFSDENHARRWLSKVTVNTAKNYIRTRKPNVNYDELANVLSTNDIDYGHTEQESAVLNAVLQLKSAYREVIHLYYYQNYDTNEIAKILNLPPPTVRSRLTRARAALEKELKGEECFEGLLQPCNEQNSGI